jgi:hypothetical protein
MFSIAFYDPMMMVVFCHVRYVYAPCPGIFMYSPWPIPYPVVMIVATYVYNIPRVMLEFDLFDFRRFHRL